MGADTDTVTLQCPLASADMDEFVNSNSSSIHSEAMGILDRVINCYLTHVIAIVGVFGNGITLIVLSRYGFKDSTNIVLTSLAGVDLFYLGILSVRKLSCIIGTFDAFSAGVYELYMLTYVYGISRLLMYLSVSHIVVVSTERLLAVFFPLKVSLWFTSRSTTCMVMCIYLAWVLILQPWLCFNRRIEWSFDINYNRSYPSIVITEWFTSNTEVLKIIGYSVLSSHAGLFCCLITANCYATLYKLRLVAKQRLTLTSCHASRNGINVKITRMLLTVCAVYCLCNVPSGVYFIYYYIFPDFDQCQDLFVALRDLEEVFIAVNCTANFFIYTLMSTKFYSSVRKLLICGNIDKKKGTSLEKSVA